MSDQINHKATLKEHALKQGHQVLQQKALLKMNSRF